MERLIHIFSFLLVLIIIVDPVNSLFAKKSFIFTVLMGLCLLRYKANLRFIPPLFAVTIVSFISLLSGMLLEVSVDYGMFYQYLLCFSLLLLLLWYERIDLLSYITYPCLALSLFSIFGMYIMQYNPSIEAVIYEFTRSHDNFILMSHRTFLGIDFVTFYYKSLIIIILPASLYFYKFLFEHGNKKRNLIFSLIFLCALYAGGNRTVLLMCFIIPLLSLIKKYKNVFGVRLLLIVTISYGLYIGYQAITEKEESSIETKQGHLRSYEDFYSEKPMAIFFGTGAGSYFYSKGFHGNTTLTEWTYIEILRMYGIFGMCIILYILLYPAFILYKKRKSYIYYYPFLTGYLLFLLSCGSNPYLLNSTGMLYVLSFYLYVFNPIYKGKILK